MTEVELAKHFLEYFADEDIYQEVPVYGGIVDIVVKRSPVTIAIEVKNALNMDVLEQAIRNTKYFNYSYIAVPSKIGHVHRVYQDICGIYGIGILVYKPTKIYSSYNRHTKSFSESHVGEVIAPSLNRKVSAPELHDWMKRSVAGSQGKRLTAFGVFVEELKDKLATSKDGIPPETLYDNVQRYYKSMKSFKSNVYQWVRTGVIKDVEYRDGKYFLKQKATQP